MFSPSLEVVLTVAYREAAARRHTHLTLEHLLYALAHDPDGERILAACGADLPQLRRDLDKYLNEHVEQFSRGQQKEPEGDAESGAGERGSGTSRDPLSAYALNLSARARAGELDPLIGRTEELQRTMEILCRRRKNNPVFVGDAGVGKTALAEGLAVRLLQDDVPEVLQGAEVFSPDTAALLAGTRFPGDVGAALK